MKIVSIFLFWRKNMLSENEKNRIKNKLKKEFPECIKCPHLEVENVEKGQLHFFYRV